MIPKITQTAWWDFGMEPVSLIRDSNQLTKRASAKSLLKYAKTKGQEDLHIIALGAYEGTGFNRNGDCFREHWCEKNAHYFVDADRAVHRHHKNKPSDPKFGNIKAAAYNKPMKRLELVVGLDIDKCADILDEQEKKGVTNWSMASKQAHDICTWCKHKAFTDSDRCEHIPDKIGEINKQGEMCGMDNPDPKWFEISYVRRGADRIGLSLNKVAGDKVSALLPRDYLSLFPDFDMTNNVISISKTAAGKRVLVNKLADIEKHIAGLGHKKIENLLPAGSTVKIAAEQMDLLRDTDPKRFFKVAATNGIILSPDNFFSFVFGSRIKEATLKEIKSVLPGIFEKCANDPSVLNNETFDVPNYIVNDGVEKKALSTFNLSHSLFSPFVNHRLAEVVKVASYNPEEPSRSEEVIALGKQYISYKLAALQYIDSLGKLSENLLFNSVLQNIV